MVYSILVFAFRKPGTSPTEFKAFYEDRHMPLLKSLAGTQFPISYARRYIHRSEANEATILAGNQADFEYDVVIEMTFKDEDAFKAFYGHVFSGENGEKIAADEEKFIDRARMKVVVVGECIVTNGA